MANVLIIDDSPTEQVGLSQMLHRHGHSCTFASTGAAGITAAKSGKPDVILMDVVMPDTNGYQATRKISTDPETKDIPIIIVSTKNQPTDRVWGLRQGAKEYLTKPVDETALMAAIASVLK
jgi:twitching motility two-component system response regulator PilH